MDELRLQDPTSLVCRVHTRRCALPVTQVLEILRPLPLETLVEAPPHVPGLMRLRGQLIPALDLSGVLGLKRPPGTPAARRLIHLAVGRRRVALLVDDVLGLHTLAETELQALPPLLSEVAAQAAVRALGRLDGELLLVLHAARLLPTLPAREELHA